MKKIILTAFLATALISCKKEAEKTDENIGVTDSTDIQNTPEAANVSLKSLSIPETADFLQKKNDTLYVTNFFATWCGPCVKEIPHFKKKIEELKDQPVKITFVSLDQKEIWNTEVPRFTMQHGIQNHTVLLDGQLLDDSFFKNNFKEWTGNAIPFTFMRRGDKTDETLGMISEEQLNEKISTLLK
ncbi:TlpA family protein disulfide reductase [Chryseobacterium turcicum]|uniref:TlpA family protein disulfide reductase n=1 Tax=Chryseobacterium turcicum TaxID=2898076 RepID=A0A9Q3V1U7_9FLAO|nr:TlpA disulfide reductase family protein [Chryseobacterium turcicum]MCD1117279.1 TlpA family protein disulfide reductase [Chryseobacterium turcicum]